MAVKNKLTDVGNLGGFRAAPVNPEPVHGPRERSLYPLGNPKGSESGPHLEATPG